ncbi:MAG: DUF6624 domain-containing protein [Acidimicrobiia bacterium]
MAQQAGREPALRNELLQLVDTPRGPIRAQRLWDILDDHECWPGYRMVDRDGEHAAWLIAQQEIDDIGLQRRCLEYLEIAVACGDADPVHQAYLEDRLRMADGRPQRFGSQFVRDDRGNLVPWHLDDLERVDARRARLGLPPFAEHARDMDEQWRARLLDTYDGSSARQQYHAATDR